MTERYAISGAIVLAGAMVAGAVVFVNRPARTAGPFPSPRSAPAVAAAAISPASVVFRPVDAARDHIRGAENAKVTLISYADTECPFCKRFHPTLQRVLQEYPQEVRWVYRHFPLSALHRKAVKESEATECAGEQGKFWEYLDELFAVTPSNDQLDPSELPRLARAVGLDVPRFEDCLKSGRLAALVQEDLEDAQKAGGRGTPYTIVVGPQGQTIPLSGALPYEILQQVIAGVLKEG